MRSSALSLADFIARRRDADSEAADSSNAAKIPSALSTRDAGALAVDGVTALDGLDGALQLKAGESILVLGASGYIVRRVDVGLLQLPDRKLQR